MVSMPGFFFSEPISQQWKVGPLLNLRLMLVLPRSNTYSVQATYYVAIKPRQMVLMTKSPVDGQDGQACHASTVWGMYYVRD